MARKGQSAAFLKKLRKKHRLGEFSAAKRKRRNTETKRSKRAAKRTIRKIKRARRKGTTYSGSKKMDQFLYELGKMGIGDIAQ